MSHGITVVILLVAELADIHLGSDKDNDRHGLLLTFIYNTDGKQIGLCLRILVPVKITIMYIHMGRVTMTSLPIVI